MIVSDKRKPGECPYSTIFIILAEIGRFDKSAEEWILARHKPRIQSPIFLKARGEQPTFFLKYFPKSDGLAKDRTSAI